MTEKIGNSKTAPATLSDTEISSDILSKEMGNIEVHEVGISDIREKVVERLTNGLNRDLNDLLTTGSQTDFLFDMMASMTESEALEVIQKAVKYHEDDENFPVETMEKMQLLLKGDEAYGMEHESYSIDLLLEATLLKYYSPYPEVRAICDPVDDVNLPVETIRAYILGTIWVAVGAFINQLFGFRQPSLSLQATAIQILLYPCGKFLEKTLPDKGFTFLGTRYSLNPGPWNHKEQMLATLMVNVGSQSSNFIFYAVTMRLEMFFNQNWVSFGFVFLMNFSTQFFGFGLAGLLRRWVVYPAKAIWPSLLPTLMLNRTLLLPESKQSVHGWTISKYKFFFIVFGIMLVYYWLPGFLFTALSNFNWTTWIAPASVPLAVITGTGLGLGFNPLSTFDWATINYSYPLSTPFFSNGNQYFGIFVGALMMIGLYWKNYKWSGYLPINSTAPFNNRGGAFNVSEIVNRDLTLNRENYRNYSPPFISLGYVVSYGSEFCMFTFSFVYLLLSEWPQIKAAAKGFWKSIRDRNASNYDMYDDPLCRMMAKYPEVPDWWYMSILIISLVFGIVACQAFPTNTPAWSIIVIIAISIGLMIPSAIIFSVTGYQLGFNDIGIVVAGYMVKENAIANMICRVYGWNVDAQAETFIGDQKLAHYAKIPPRAQLRAQLWATVIQTFITIAALNVLLNGIPNICSYDQPGRFFCPFNHSLYTATLVWGVVGPQRVFNTLYPTLKWAFLIGVVIAPPVYYIRRYFFKYLRHFSPVLFLAGMGRFQSGYNLSYYTPGLEVSFVFMYWIRRRYLAWWSKYNYVLASALGAGVAFGAILIFVCLQVPEVELSWWGNEVSSAGVDGGYSAALYEVADGEFFGPRTWD